MNHFERNQKWAARKKSLIERRANRAARKAERALKTGAWMDNFTALLVEEALLHFAEPPSAAYRKLLQATCGMAALIEDMAASRRGTFRAIYEMDICLSDACRALQFLMGKDEAIRRTYLRRLISEQYRQNALVAMPTAGSA